MVRFLQKTPPHLSIHKPTITLAVYSMSEGVNINVTLPSVNRRRTPSSRGTDRQTDGQTDMKSAVIIALCCLLAFAAAEEEQKLAEQTLTATQPGQPVAQVGHNSS